MACPRPVVTLLATGCVILLSACGVSGSTPASVDGAIANVTSSSTSSQPVPSKTATRPQPAPTLSAVPLPPDFDAYQNACVRLKTLSQGVWQLAPPMTLSSPQDASRQAQSAKWLKDQAESTVLEDFGDPRVNDARIMISVYINSLAELRRSANRYATSPSSGNYQAWEESWHVVNGSATSLTFGCR